VSVFVSKLGFVLYNRIIIQRLDIPIYLLNFSLLLGKPPKLWTSLFLDIVDAENSGLISTRFTIGLVCSSHINASNGLALLIELLS